MSNLSNHILEEIQCQKLCPIPAWQFAIKEVLLWTIMVLVSILGAISLTPLMAQILDPGLASLFEHSQYKLLFNLAPALWLLFFLLMYGLAICLFKVNRCGYRFSTSTLLLSSVLISGTLSFGFYKVGLDELLDGQFVNHIPAFKSLLDRDQLWLQPEHGRLMGQVLAVHQPQAFLLQTSSGEQWLVLSNPKTIIPSADSIRIGQTVRVHGEISAAVPSDLASLDLPATQKVFEAEQIW